MTQKREKKSKKKKDPNEIEKIKKKQAQAKSRVKKRLDLFRRAIGGDSKALIEITIQRGMAKRGDFSL